MYLRPDNSPQEISDAPYALKCPHCGVQSNITAISVPRYEYAAKFKPLNLGIAYRCDACNRTVFLRFTKISYDLQNSRILISPEYYELVEHTQETFELGYLPEIVAQDFAEALACYSNECFNAFAAMCRRSIQSAFEELGASGKDKVLNQLRDVKDTAAIDDETFELLKQIVIAGHDGAHPNLPSLNPDRAAILLELMKDVLYQLFVRKKKIEEAMRLRKNAIDASKEGDSES